MSDRVRNHEERKPRERLQDPATAVFFPGEVVRLLGLGDIEYAQLRRLYLLSRELRGLHRPPGNKWGRFSLGDLACVEQLVKLGGGRAALVPGRRLILGDVRQACRVLRAAGVSNPLLEVDLVRVKGRLLATVDGYVFEPATGQMVLEGVDAQVRAFLESRVIKDATVRKAINLEKARLRPPRATQAALIRELGQLPAASSQGAPSPPSSQPVSG